MNNKPTYFILLIFILILVNSASTAQTQKRIALTYDDAPRNDTALTGADRASKLVAGLTQAGVAQAAFFVTTNGINSPQRLKRIQSYAAAGHVIANHSHTHPWLHSITYDAYLADIDRAEETLVLFDNKRPWFRYPYLNEAPTIEKRDAVREGLKARGLRNGYVTIDTFDWYLDNLYQKAMEEGRAICLPALGRLYVHMLVDAANFYEQVAQDTIGRSPAHTLLLHENDIAALFVVDLVEALQNDGWLIVTADEAYADPIAQVVPDTLALGAGRIAAMAIVNGRDPESLSLFATDEDKISEAFQSSFGVMGKCQ